MTHPRSHPLRKLSLLLLAAAPALAQPASPTLKINTRLTQVDVTAADINGHPVQGLKQSDFTIKEDNKPQPIKNFEESGAAKPEPTAPPPQLPPNTYTNAHLQSSNTSPINVFLVDNITTGYTPGMAPANVATSRSEAIRYVRTMPAGTQVVILELTNKLRVVQSLTADRDVLYGALDSIIPQSSPRTALPPPPYCSPDQSRRNCTPPSEFCAAANTQSEVVTAALKNASAFLSGLSGRKNLIWFTPGIPWLTDPTAFAQAYEIDCLDDYTSLLQQDYNLLTTAQVALYLVNPRGLEGCGASVNCVRGATQDHLSMENIADATGGQAFYNSNDIAAAIGRAIAIGTDYYSLSYVPPLTKYDGQYHKINIAVDRPGIRLTYRKGYTAIDPAKTSKPAATPTTSSSTPPPTEAALYAAMSHGAAPATEIIFTVAVTPSILKSRPGDPIIGQLDPRVKNKPLTRYDFTYTLSPNQLMLAETADGNREASVEFTVAAYSATSEILNVIRQTASLTLKPAQVAEYLKRDIPMHLQLDLPPGPLFLRAAVRDISSNKLGTLEIPLTVPK